MSRKTKSDINLDDIPGSRRNKFRRSFHIEEDEIIDVKPKVKKEDVDILNKNCKSIQDLIDISEVYIKYTDFSLGYHYTHEELNISEYKYESIKKISKMIDELRQINDLIGLEKIKTQLVSQIAYLLADYRESLLMHTVISGNAGVGKTMISKLISKAYYKSGILKSNKYIFATRENLVAAYVGQTAIKTTALFNKAKGGVFFIDEAYNLGHSGSDNGDSFSKECIDTLNQLLSENTDTMCIIAGYHDEIEKCFFGANRGLPSRFPWRFEIDKYSGNDLYRIFELECKKGTWTFDSDAINPEFFTKNIDYFQAMGRDIQTFYNKCCIQHALRLFLSSSDKNLTKEDIKNAFSQMKEMKDLHMKKDEPPMGMYI